MSKLIIGRHAQSILNNRNYYSGKLNTPLSFDGVLQSKTMSKVLQDENIDICFTSSLFRTQETIAIMLEEYCKYHHHYYPAFLNSLVDYNDNCIPIIQDYRLDERSYGVLEGLSKSFVLNTYGETIVNEWRRGWNKAPEGGESLENVCVRVRDFIEKTLIPLIETDKTILIICHQNSMRAFTIIFQNIPPNKVNEIEYENGSFLKYEYTKDKWIQLQ